MTTAAVVSFRLGGRDGVAVEARKWIDALQTLGVGIRTVAGTGSADVLVAGLGIDDDRAVDHDALAEALAGVDVVIVENLLSLPLNPPAAAAVAGALAGRPAVLHHHDLPWQRERFAGWPPPPHDPRWVHVTINERSRGELAAAGIDAITLYNRFAIDAPSPNRDATRTAAGLTGRVALHPTRAIPRKNVPAALALAEAIGATYWLVGDAEDGYGDELGRLLAAARVPVLRAAIPPGRSIADAYAACDLVVFPSTWEGFGNPTIESAIHRRPLAVARYPVAEELLAFGFRWFDPGDAAGIDAFLRDPDDDLLDHNRRIARDHFSLDRLPSELAAVLERVL
ncbi:MAG TPA: glycosyltransferase [Acidimicrobiales bacterium]|nr:glycosyltransferase [Acidimicrobiales bacterium]